MKKFPNFKNRELTYFGRRVEPYFTSSMIINGLSDPKLLKKHFGLTKPIAMVQVGYEFFNVQSTVDAFLQNLAHKLGHTSKHYITKVVRGCIKSGGQLLNVSWSIHAEVGSAQFLSTKNMIRLLKKYHKEARAYSVYYTVAWFEKPEFEVANDIAKRYSKNATEFARIFSAITVPSTETVAEHEQDDFLRLGAMAHKKDKSFLKEVKRHAQKFGWLGVRFFVGDPWTERSILDRMKSINPKEAKAQLKARVIGRKKREEVLKPLLKRMSASDRELVKQIRDVIYLRTQRADFYHQSSYFLQPLMKKIAEYLEINYMDLLNFNTKEIIAALKGTYDIKSHFKNRRENMVMYHGPTSVSLEGRQASAYIAKRSILSAPQKITQELKGNATYQGIVRGKVRVVLEEGDAVKVGKGDILVSTMTTPNLIAAMERAAAFVTDEGGILCHAAIVSREMKKPCIIGTKFATKVLKDGDKVEVDANRGLVKIL